MQPQASCSGRAVGGAAGVWGNGDGSASWPGALPGVVDAVSCGGRDRVGGDAELVVQGLVVSGGAVMFDADAAAGVTDDLLPAAGDPGFHADPGPDAGRQDRVPVGRVLRGEPFHAWH